jgi:small GTP-binding protein
MTGPPILKVVFLGSFHVGKTCLLFRFTKGAFEQNPNPTLSPAKVCLPVRNDWDRVVHLDLWDTAGQEKFQPMNASYLRNVDVALVCYEQPELSQIEPYIAEVQCASPNVHILLVATKNDIRSPEAAKQIEDFGTQYVETHEPTVVTSFVTSALSGEGVDALLGWIASARERSTTQPAESVPIQDGQTGNICC